MLEHKCEVCGRLNRKKIKADGKIVCLKHYRQFKKHKKFLDNQSRTIYDNNEIKINGNIAYIQMYDKLCNPTKVTIIDADDVDKVKYIKWRVNCNGYAISSSNNLNSKTMFLHRVILDTNNMVDHINGNRLDNRKSNLRICDKSTNQMNVNYKGYYQKDNGKWFAKIKLNKKQIHLGTFLYEEESKYARWYAEQLLFKDFAYNKEEPFIINSRKKEIQQLVNRKVQRLQ